MIRRLWLLLLIGMLAFAFACGGDDDDDAESGDDDGGATATLDGGDDESDDDSGGTISDICNVATADEISGIVDFEVSDTLDTSDDANVGCNWAGAGGTVYVTVWTRDAADYYELAGEGEPVEGLGNEAKWKGEGIGFHAIAVLTNDYSMDIAFSAGDSVDQDRENAITLSELMLERLGQ